jgi:cyanophycin synthetase
VQRNGFSVLNGDDCYTARMARHAGGQVIFFSLHSGENLPEHMREHIARGGLAVLREPGPNGGMFVIHDDGERIPVMRPAEIPATLHGLAEFNIQNALAAVAICYAHGIAPRLIRQGLTSFTSSFEQSPGRLNVFDGHGFRVILDYAHNPAGLRAIGDLIRKLRPHYGRVIGMVNIPGDRRDHDIREMGEIAAGLFDEIVFREDPARRGRKPGEIVSMLAEGALAVGFPPTLIHTILDEREAADTCLKAAKPGDLVVLTPTEVEDMWHQVMAFGSRDCAAQIAAPCHHEAAAAVAGSSE